MEHLNREEVLLMQIEAQRRALREVRERIVALAGAEGLVSGTPAAQQVRELVDIIKESAMSNHVPGGLVPAPFNPQAAEAPARVNPVPQVQVVPQQPAFQQQMNRPPQNYPPTMAAYAHVQAPTPVQAPAPVSQGAPPQAPVPANALTPPQPVPMVAAQPTSNPVPVVGAPVAQPPEPQLVVNPLPQVAMSAPFIPPPEAGAASRIAALEAELRRARAEEAQGAPAQPKQPPYYALATSQRGRRYLHRPSPAVTGAQRFAAPANAVILPSSDLRGICLPVREVPEGGSGVGYAVTALREAITCARTGSPPPGYLSPAYVQQGILRAAPSVGIANTGASVAEELAVLLNFGAPPEAFVPLDCAYVDSPIADVAALPWRLSSIIQIDLGPQAEANVKAMLAQRPVVVTFLARASFESPGEGGLLALPGDDEPILGAHAVLLVGYDDRGWIVRDACGAQHGDGGYVIMPRGYERSWFEAWTADAGA